VESYALNGLYRVKNICQKTRTDDSLPCYLLTSKWVKDEMCTGYAVDRFRSRHVVWDRLLHVQFAAPQEAQASDKVPIGRTRRAIN
jgi:hypothetical protein